MHNPEYPHPAEEADKEERSRQAYEEVKPELEKIKKKLSDNGNQGEKNSGTFPQETIDDARRQTDEFHPKEDE